MMDGYEKNFEKELNYAEELENQKKGKKAKKKKQVKAPKKKEGNIILATVCIITAFVVFMVLVAIKDRLVNGGTTANVVVAVAEVPKGAVLTEQNMSTYFVIEQRDAETVPAGIIYENARGMMGKTTGRVIHAKEIVTTDCFIDESYLDEIDDPVILALDLGSLGQTVSGVLRAGDVIDIRAIIKMPEQKSELDGVLDINGGGLLGVDETYPGGLFNIDPVDVVDEEGTVPVVPMETDRLESVSMDTKGEVLRQEEVDLAYGVTGEYVSQLLAENVRIVSVFTSGGERSDVVEAGGSSMVATVVNIAVPSSMVDSILIAKEEGKLTLVKVDEERRALAEENEEMEKVMAEGMQIEDAAISR